LGEIGMYFHSSAATVSKHVSLEYSGWRERASDGGASGRSRSGKRKLTVTQGIPFVSPILSVEL